MGSRGICLHSFLTSVLDGGVWSFSCPDCCTLRKELAEHNEWEAEWAPEVSGCLKSERSHCQYQKLNARP